GRFTLTLALAALVPISLAAFVATRVVATSYREDYEATRASTEQVLDRELVRLRNQVKNAAVSLAGHDSSLVANLLLDLENGAGTLDAAARRRAKEGGGTIMRGLTLDILAITGPDDTVLVSPHYRAATGEIN